MANSEYSREHDRDCIAFLLGEAAANRKQHPAIACALARAAKGIADQRHREPPSSTVLADFQSALPTHEERVWGADIDPRILERLDKWIMQECEESV